MTYLKRPWYNIPSPLSAENAVKRQQALQYTVPKKPVKLSTIDSAEVFK